MDGFYWANLTLMFFLPGAMQGQRGWKLQGKTFFLLLWATNSFKLHAGKSKRKAAVMLLKSFLIIHDHLPRHTESHHKTGKMNIL